MNAKNTEKASFDHISHFRFILLENTTHVFLNQNVGESCITRPKSACMGHFIDVNADTIVQSYR